jgi:pimeloyl-ACP methyl ester carboxylesterase
MKRNILLKLFCLLLTVTTFENSFCQFSKPGPQIETFYSTIDGSEQPYSLFLPLDFAVNKTYPLVIMLHGAWANHRSAIFDVIGKGNNPAGNDLVESYKFYTDFYGLQYIIACPFGRGTMGYQGIPEDDVMRVIEECKRNFHIDENRVYLTGLSMGGGGTFYLGLTRPDLFAAIAPVCPAPPPDAWELWGNALDLPVSVHQGGADPAVNPESTRFIVSELQKAGVLVEYNEYPEIGHDIWVNAYKNGAIFKWFDKIKRNPFPERVHYTAKWYKYNTAYWVLLDKLTPGTLATIDAQFKGENLIDIKTTNLEGFTLRLEGHPMFSSLKQLSVTINGLPIVSAPKDNHSFNLKEGKWITGKYIAPVSWKHPGLEGPMAQAIYERHVYVYGTGGSTDKDELQKRIDQANKAADYSGGLSRPNEITAVHPRVMSDKQFRPETMGNTNVVLFGTKETNSAIERYSDRLPYQLNADAKDYGLVYCFPIDGHLVVVSSGIPFWTAKPPAPPAPPAAPRTAPAATSAPVRSSINFMAGSGGRALVNFKDFLLFKSTNDNTVVDSYFDQAWKLPATEIAKLKTSGVVIIKEK